VSAAKYDECIKLLKKAGAGNPAGRSYQPNNAQEHVHSGQVCNGADGHG
jgi:hypothetical protein